MRDLDLLLLILADLDTAERRRPRNSIARISSNPPRSVKIPLLRRPNWGWTPRPTPAPAPPGPPKPGKTSRTDPGINIRWRTHVPHVRWSKGRPRHFTKSGRSLVGETRELAKKRAALTGHLVGTLHANDAPSTIARLDEMGVEPFMVSAIGIPAAQGLASPTGRRNGNWALG